MSAINEIRQKMNDGSERIMRISMPFDKRHPNPKKNYGISPMVIYLIYLKDNNATQFSFSVPFYLPHVACNLPHKSLWEGMGYDVGYHANKPQYESQTPMKNCDLLKEGQCYYDGSSLLADERYKQFIGRENAFDWAWKQLEQDWENKFGSKFRGKKMNKKSKRYWAGFSDGCLCNTQEKYGNEDYVLAIYERKENAEKYYEDVRPVEIKEVKK